MRLRAVFAVCALVIAVFAACSHQAPEKRTVTPQAVGIGRGLPDQPWLHHFIRPPRAVPVLGACDTDAMLVKSAPPEFPEQLRRPGHPIEWTVDVAVRLNAKGRVQNTAVVSSYGQTTQNHTVVRLALNAQAIKAANAATYRPKFVHCRSVPSTYRYRITFTGGP